MSDKSAREAELEALRNAKAATNQVQKLGKTKYLASCRTVQAFRFVCILDLSMGTPPVSC